MTARDLLLSKRLPGNPFDQQAAAQRALAELANREIIVPQLSGIAQDFGLINAGTIVMGNGQPLGSGFTGVMQFADPLEWPTGSGQLWHYIGFNADVMMFGISALDGKLYAAGGKMTVDSSAINMNDLLYALSQTVPDGVSGYFYSRFGMSSTVSGDPVGIWSFTGDPGSNLLANPGFEAGTLTGWTVNGESWSATDAQAHSGSYSALVTNSGAGAQIGRLDANQVAVTPNTDYELSAWVRKASGTLVPYGLRLQVEWYTAAVGGTYIITDQVLLPYQTGQWVQGKGFVTAPGNAQGAIVRCYMATIGSGTAYFDDVSFATISPATRITLEPDVNIRGAELYIKDNKAHAGHEAGLGSYNNNGGEVTIYSRVIKGGALGTFGFLRLGLFSLFINTTGANRSVTYRYYLGSTKVGEVSSGSIATGNVRLFKHEGVLTDLVSLSAQRFALLLFNGNGTFSEVDGTATENTAADLTFSVTAQLSIASTNLYNQVLGGMMFGPYYHAS